MISEFHSSKTAQEYQWKNISQFSVFTWNYETFLFDVCCEFKIKLQVLSTSFMVLKQTLYKLLSWTDSANHIIAVI